jgi:hypothetical protein
MNDAGVLVAVEALLGSDPDVADREALGEIVRSAATLRSFVDLVDVRCNRRAAQLAAEGQSESPLAVLMDEGRRSGREAKAAQERDRVCSEFPEFEDALAAGGCSSDHLDVLARLTRDLSDAERSDLHAVTPDLVASATTDYVSQFERRTKDVIAHIRSINAPSDESAELDRQREQSHLKRWTDKPTGMKMTLLALDPLRDAAFHSVVDAHLARLRQDPGNAMVPFAQLQVDAVVAAVSVGEPEHRIPEVVIHVDHESACHGRHEHTLCETSDGTPLPVATAQRLCCEAIISAVIVDPDGSVRALCADRRTANRHQRRALRAMYRTCAHPHCEVGFDHCRIHHVIWWTNGGRTELSNLIPLCELHHHLVHEGGWGLELRPDRHVTWTRPDGTIWSAGMSIDRTRPEPGGRRPEPPTDPLPERRQPSLC